jgi:hypothetical protein
MPFITRSTGRVSRPVCSVSTDHRADRIGTRVNLRPLSTPAAKRRVCPVERRVSSLSSSRRSQLGWQPSRFLTDRGEAERAFALAEQLGSVNAAAAELGTTWPSLRKAFTRRGLGMPARNPEAVRQRAIAAADTRRPGPRDALPLDPVFVALNPGQLPAARRPKAEQGVRLRRGEEIETLRGRFAPLE